MDSYYFEEFFTAIYNAQNDERPITDIFLFLPSRKVINLALDDVLLSDTARVLDLSRLLSNSNETHRSENDSNENSKARLSNT
jgi:hypothetical protein